MTTRFSKLLALLSFLLVASPAWTAVAFDNKAVAPTEFNVQTITTPAFTISGTNRAAILCLWLGLNSATGVTMSLGGVQGTAILGADTGTTNGNIRVVCFSVTAPPTGSQTATASWTGSMAASLGVITATGVNQTTPVTNGNFSTPGFVTSAPLTIASSNGDLTVTVYGTTTNPATVTTDRTERFANGSVFKGDTGPGTGTTTHTWTASSSDVMSVAGANFKSAGTELWTGIVDPSRAVTWETAGAGAIPSRPQCGSTLLPGVTVGDINAAINNCKAINQGQPGYVLLGAGTFTLSGAIQMKSDVILRGSGADQTKLVFTGNADPCSAGGGAHFAFCGSFNWSGGAQNFTAWTAGYVQGATTLTLQNATGITPNQTVLILDQQNDATDPLPPTPPNAGEIFVCDTTTCSSEGGSPGRQPGPPQGTGIKYNQQEYKLVTAVNGNQVTISPPLYYSNWDTRDLNGSIVKNHGAW
jgi:hypothetical protein